jgi:hypothetical protein
MKRCRWIALLSPVVFAASAFAQGGVLPGLQASTPDSATGTWRQFPLKAERGTLRIVGTPEVLLNGKADRLSPGARIRGIHNSVMTPVSLGDGTYVVNYLRNAQGDVHDVWLLTPDEAKAKLPTMAREKKRSEPVDDGKTPFDQLPKWNPASPR